MFIDLGDLVVGDSSQHVGQPSLRILLPQHADDLLFAEPASFQIRSLSCGPDSSSPWRGNKGAQQIVKNKAVYLALDITGEGKREVLGLFDEDGTRNRADKGPENLTFNLLHTARPKLGVSRKRKRSGRSDDFA